MKKKNKTIKKVLLLGASVGKAWNFEDLSKRSQNNSYVYEFIAKYKPDKTDILEQVLHRKENKPDALIIKQCAAYFRSDSKVYKPKHVQRYKHLIDEWVKKCKKEDVVPILATVVPISEEIPFMVKIKRLIKKHILFRNISPSYRAIQLKGILDYNDWIKAYAKENRLTVLDLEAAVRVSDKDRYLNFELTTDGLHLNEDAYRFLDPIVLESLNIAVKNSIVVNSNEHQSEN